MHLGTFSLYTLGGSGLWNGALIGLGYALGTYAAYITGLLLRALAT